MNLAAYDIVNTGIDRSKTWIDPRYNKLYSREIKNRRNFYTFSKNYNPSTDSYSIHLILLDNNIGKDKCLPIIDKVGVFKVNISRLLDIISPINHPRNIDIIHSEHSDDGDIYELIF